jgi:hypothetical protein
MLITLFYKTCLLFKSFYKYIDAGVIIFFYSAVVDTDYKIYYLLSFTLLLLKLLITLLLL